MAKVRIVGVREFFGTLVIHEQVGCRLVKLWFNRIIEQVVVVKLQFVDGKGFVRLGQTILSRVSVKIVEIIQARYPVEVVDGIGGLRGERGVVVAVQSL